MNTLKKYMTTFGHRASVFATPFVLAGGLAVEQGIRNGSLNMGDYKAIGLAFVSGVVIAALNYVRGQVPPSIPAAPATAVATAPATAVATAPATAVATAPATAVATAASTTMTTTTTTTDH